LNWTTRLNLVPKVTQKCLPNLRAIGAVPIAAGMKIRKVQPTEGRHLVLQAITFVSEAQAELKWRANSILHEHPNLVNF
jgi:hypothetical protein